MNIQELSLNQFRSFQNLHVEFSRGMNILYGENGVGKTTVLEAVHCLALSKSFRTVKDRELIKRESDFFQLEGKFLNSENIEHEVRLNTLKDGRRKIFLDGSELKRAIDLIGRFPVVMLTPEDAALTFRGPAEKRKFADRILSQTDKEYLNLLMDFRRTLHKRNASLELYDKKRKGYDLFFETIDEKFCELTRNITIKRTAFFEEFEPIFREIHQSLSHKEKTVRIRYNPNFSCEEDFRNQLKEKFPAEVTLHHTLSGSHLDRVTLIMNEHDIRGYGSQGEHKLVLVALKITEGKYIEDKTGSAPIYLLDDLFSELDVQHSANIVDKIRDLGQILITSTDLHDLRRHGVHLEGDDLKIFSLPLESS